MFYSKLHSSTFHPSFLRFLLLIIGVSPTSQQILAPGQPGTYPNYNPQQPAPQPQHPQPQHPQQPQHPAPAYPQQPQHPAPAYPQQPQYPAPAYPQPFNPQYPQVSNPYPLPPSVYNPSYPQHPLVPVPNPSYPNPGVPCYPSAPQPTSVAFSMSRGVGHPHNRQGGYVTFQQETLKVNAGTNPASGKFTVSVPGIYWVSLAAQASHTAGFRLTIRMNNDVIFSLYAPQSQMMSQAALVSAQVGNVIYPWLEGEIADAVFSGYLLTPTQSFGTFVPGSSVYNSFSPPRSGGLEMPPNEMIPEYDDSVSNETSVI